MCDACRVTIFPLLLVTTPATQSKQDTILLVALATPATSSHSVLTPATLSYMGVFSCCFCLPLYANLTTPQATHADQTLTILHGSASRTWA